MQVKVKYHYDNLARLEKIEQGDWIDLRAAEDIDLPQGEFKLIPLGVSMEIPKGYEAHLVPRGSTFKKYGIIQTNHVGIIDNSYNGDNDRWYMPALAMRDTYIPAGHRICQFRLVKNQEPLDFVEVDSLNNTDRGAFGSTGTE